MSRGVGIGQLEGAVAEILAEYGERATDAIRDAAPKAAKQARKELRATSPRGYGRRHYAEGWALQSQDGRNGIRVVVHNKTKPGLTHLLEFGHAMKGGGRAPAHPHIAAVNDKAQKEFIEEVTRRLGQG